MRSTLFKFLCFFFTITMSCAPAFATEYNAPSPVYVSTYQANDSVEQSEMLWGEAGIHNAVITSAVIRYLAQSGDVISINWFNSDSSFISSINLSNSGEYVTAPAGAYGAKILLSTGSSTGGRGAWWSSVSADNGNITYFPDPDTSGWGDDGGGGCDVTPVVDSLEYIQGQLSEIKEKLSSCSSVAVVDAIQSQTNTIVSNFNNLNDSLIGIKGQVSDVNSRLNTVIDQLDTVQNQLDTTNDKLTTIDTHVSGIQNYLTAPRTSQPFSNDMPTMPQIDHTPPPVTETPQEKQPYNYNRSTSQFKLPPVKDSPGPLPLAPDPKVMEHDQPTQIEFARQPDSDIKEAPRQSDPVIKDAPRPSDPVIKDAPRPSDPVIKDAPRTPDSVVKDEPIARDNPTQRDNPLATDPPLTPEPSR